MGFLRRGDFDGMHRLDRIKAMGPQCFGRNRRLTLRDGGCAEAPMREPAADPTKRDEDDRRRNLQPTARGAPPLDGKIGNAQTRWNWLRCLELQALAQAIACRYIRGDAFAERRVVGEKAADKRVTLGREASVDKRVEIVFADRRVGNHFTLRNWGADPVSMAWRKRSRARLKRDMTVPMGISRAFAISA